MKMELIAALLHKPKLLLLDEPTIGLDVVAQVKIQDCLLEYNRTRGMTMLLTSHYMRDVEALCDRVLVINHGKLVFDGPLEGIAQRFGQEKILKLQFDGPAPTTLETFGTVTTRNGPMAELKVDRKTIAAALNALLDQHNVVDLSVEDPPLEEMIAKVFAEGAKG
jgi:ABC-2 type transport system ATP-binding protein